MSAAIETADQVLGTCIKAASAYGRDDLVSVLEAERTRLKQGGCHIVVVGEFKQGKSSLVNALLETDLCPVDDDIATAIPTFLRFGDPASASAHRSGSEPESLDTLTLRSAITGVASDGEPAEAIEVLLPRRLLAEGLVLVDTPGVGGLDSAHGARTLAALNGADAVIFVTDASQELTEGESEFLGRAVRACDEVVVAVPKVDFYPAWRKVSSLTASHIVDLGLQVPLFPVSSPIRLEASRASSADLNEESGFVPLVGWIRARVADVDRIRVATAGRVAVDAIAQMRTAFTNERDSLLDPAGATDRAATFKAAAERIEALRHSGSRWQQSLADGVSDLAGEVGSHLKEGLRAALEDGSRVIDATDPISTWDELSASIEKQVRDVTIENAALLRERSTALAVSLQELFGEDTAEAIESHLHDGSFDLTLAKAEAPSGSIAGSALTALRGSYSGILMFNMLGGMVGLTAIAPVSIGLGVVLGIKALKGEKERRLAGARQSAKLSLRRFADEASGHTSKENQDAIKIVQRTLRDTYTSRLRVLQKTSADSYEAAKRAATTGADERQRRAIDIGAELDRLAALQGQVISLMEESP